METITITEPLPLKAQAISVTQKSGVLAAAFTICFISVMFSGVSSMLMSVYLTAVVKGLIGNVTPAALNNVTAYINAIFIFGSMFGGFAWGVICDRIGRSKAVILSTAVYGVFTILTAFSSSWVMVGIYRFITGFGVGGVILTTNILVAELWPEKKKAIALGIVSAAMPVGFVAAGAFNVLLPNWHQAFLTGIIPVGTAIVAVFVLAESASWQHKSQLPAQSGSGTSVFAKGYRKNLLTGSLIFGSMLIGLWAIFSWTPTWIQSIAGPGTESQGLGGLAMMDLAICGLLGSVASGWIANAIGLRRTMIMCFAVCFVMTFVVFKLNTVASAATFIQMGVLAFFFGISQGALSVYIPALFPTIVRASATGFCFNAGRVFTGPVVFFIGALVTFLGGYGNAVFIFSFIFLIGLLITFFSRDSEQKEELTEGIAFAE